MREWYQETHEKQQDLNIMVLASSSTVVMQDESFPACKIELWLSWSRYGRGSMIDSKQIKNLVHTFTKANILDHIPDSQ